MKQVLLIACCLASAWGAEWPQFRGPNRDGKSSETGLLKQWPEGGPKLLWTVPGIGHGFSSVAVANGLVYTTGNVGRNTVITAIDPAGKVQWTTKNGPACRHQHNGTRSTPTIIGTHLYHLNADGDLLCADARTGKREWARNIVSDFGARVPTWGLAESVLVDGNRVICTVGGEKVAMAALDRLTGETKWTCTGHTDLPGYCSPLLVEHGGPRQIVTLMASSIVGVDADSGQLLWTVKHKTPFDENIATPIFHDGHLFVSTRTTGSRLFRVKVEGKNASVEQVWHTTDMDNQHGGVILLDGHLYATCHRTSSGPWVCLEFKTGRKLLGDVGIGRATIHYADGMLYVQSHRGTMALVRPSPQRFDLVSQFRIPKGGRGPYWAHPATCGGRLYVRHSDVLHCYDVRAR